jgi:hypothetical protein
VQDEQEINYSHAAAKSNPTKIQQAQTAAESAI